MHSIPRHSGTPVNSEGTIYSLRHHNACISAPLVIITSLGVPSDLYCSLAIINRPRSCVCSHDFMIWIRKLSPAIRVEYLACYKMQ